MEKTKILNMLKTNRKRYIKGADGTTESSYYERIFTGIMVGGKAYEKNRYIDTVPGLERGDMVFVFCLGNTLDEKNVVFLHKRGDSVVYANVNHQGKKEYEKYINYYAEDAGCEIQWVDSLPTVVHTRGSNGPKVQSLQDLMDKAAADSIDF